MAEKTKQFTATYGTASDEDDDNSCVGVLLTFFSYLLVFITLPLSIWGCIKVVQEYERAVIFRLGRLKSGGAKGPGLFFIVPCIDNYRCVDLRTGAFDVPPQEILTRDSVTVSVDAVVYYQVSLGTLQSHLGISYHLIYIFWVSEVPPTLVVLR